MEPLIDRLSKAMASGVSRRSLLKAALRGALGAAALELATSLPRRRSTLWLPPAMALGNGVALIPPMGWSSWYGFFCNVDQDIVSAAADALVSTGMQAAGYQYVHIDDCWQEGRRRDGTIAADATRFPDGMPALIDYVHSRGLKFGLYTDVGATTCQGRPGSRDHLQKDADTYASWGVDYVKVDWCDTDGLDPQTEYARVRDALAASAAAYNQPIVFSICDWGVNNPWEWGPATGNLWRTTADVGSGEDRWQQMLDVLDENARHAAVAGPGAWNDPDFLQAGLGGQIGNGGMTEIEERSQFSMWAIMAAPLFASNDLTIMTDYTRQTLTNVDAIAIDQDAAGIQGQLLNQDGTGMLQAWSRPLHAAGTYAVALFNRSRDPAKIGVTWRDLGLASGRAAVKDIWAGTAPAPFTDAYTTTVQPHSVTLLLVSGAAS